MPFDQHLAERVRAILAENTPFDEKRMFGGLAFMVNGHMCCGVAKTDLVVRVGAPYHQDALSHPHTRPMDFTGQPMQGFVYVAPAGFRTKRQLSSWIQRGLTFARSLPAK